MEKHNNTTTKSMIKIMLSYAKPYKLRFITLFATTVLQASVIILFPIMYGLVIDEIIYHRNLTAFLNFAIIIGILVAVSIIFELIITASFWNTQLRFVLDLRIGIMKRVYYAFSSFLTKMKSGDVIHSVNLDTPDFMNVITDNVFEFISTLSIYIMTLAFVTMINIKAAIFMFFAVPMTVLLSQQLGKISQRLSGELRSNNGYFTSWIFEMLKGIREIQLFSGEKSALCFFAKYYKKIIRIQKKIMLTNVAVERANNLISIISDICFYILGAYLIYNNEITIGSFISIMSLMALANTYLSRLSGFFVILKARQANIQRACGYLTMENEEDVYNDILPCKLKGDIEFKEVSFSYEQDKKVLNNISFKVTAGESLAVVGRSGSGKSTVVSLLLRFFEPDKGQILIDGQDITRCSYKLLRRSIGVVQQDVLVFEGTIRHNLLLGNQAFDEGKIWEACEKAYIADFLRTLPQGLDTVIGKDGINLSGGQKQRISIARIFLRNPKILVFDEATSALDYEAEKAIQNAWLELSKDKTSIIIAHRLSTIINSDKVAVIHDGSIVSWGHHLSLLETSSHYKDLFYAQYLGEELEQ